MRKVTLLIALLVVFVAVPVFAQHHSSNSLYVVIPGSSAGGAAGLGATLTTVAFPGTIPPTATLTVTSNTAGGTISTGAGTATSSAALSVTSSGGNSGFGIATATINDVGFANSGTGAAVIATAF